MVMALGCRFQKSVSRVCAQRQLGGSPPASRLPQPKVGGGPAEGPRRQAREQVGRG
jgi:hypothetical protein